MNIAFRLIAVVLSLFMVIDFAAAESSDGKISSNTALKGDQLFQENCASCHQLEGSKIPPLSTLQKMAPDYILNALTNGKMAPQGFGMAINEIVAIKDWLTKDQTPEKNWIDQAMCEDLTPKLVADSNITDWGYGLRNHRRQSAEDGGIDSSNIESLKLKWSMAFPKVTQMRAQPALVGDTLFLAVADSFKVYALDVNEGCVKWEYSLNAPPRTSIGYGNVTGKSIIWFGDAGGNVHVLNAFNGEVIWKKDIRMFTQSMVTGQPVLHERTLYIPVSLYEIFSAMLPTYECCSGHGAVLAVDVMTGEELWSWETMENATKTGVSSNGTQQWGPSGAPIWNSPAIDEKRGLLYFGTGENTSDPATASSDAIFALDMKTGQYRWHFQATKLDTFNSSCFGGSRNGPNCPKRPGPDHDFGASMMLITLDKGKSSERDIVVAGQKSGTVWALDPDNQGKLLWSKTLSTGEPKNGGIHWGMAYDGQRLFVPIADALSDPNFVPQPALHALDPATGDVIWTTKITSSCDYDPKVAATQRNAGKPLSCFAHPGLSAPATVAGDVVFVGGLDGMYRAFDTKTGKILWQDDTNKAYKGINGINGHGGSIDSNGTIISKGRVIIQSGYSMHGQMPGNMLLQYTVGGK